MYRFAFLLRDAWDYLDYPGAAERPSSSPLLPEIHCHSKHSKHCTLLSLDTPYTISSFPPILWCINNSKNFKYLTEHSKHISCPRCAIFTTPCMIVAVTGSRNPFQAESWCESALKPKRKGLALLARWIGNHMSWMDVAKVIA